MDLKFSYLKIQILLLMMKIFLYWNVLEIDFFWNVNQPEKILESLEAVEADNW